MGCDYWAGPYHIPQIIWSSQLPCVVLGIKRIVKKIVNSQCYWKANPYCAVYCLCSCVAKALSFWMKVSVFYCKVDTNGVQADRKVYFDNFKRLSGVSKRDIIGIRVSDDIRFRYLMI